MPITLGELAKDPSLIETLRLPPGANEDPDALFEDATYFEQLGELVEKHPIHTPSVRRG